MALPPGSGVAFDAAGFGGLKLAAQREDPEAVREAAQQFEALLVQNMLKNMRAASGEDGLFGSSQMDSYYEMFDQQVALEMARNGGLGLADVLVQQMAAREEGAVSQAAMGAGFPVSGKEEAPRAGLPVERASATGVSVGPESAADVAGQLLRSARIGQLERAARELPAQETAPAAAKEAREGPVAAE